ncbi:serine/threonine-protein kinase [Kibdelosporangium aridum]|uniref:serine/threonine-protein kinase n=1 Tax=Kibdelosporangium aridum TaxID=2030 RepID=UPI00069051E5
MRSGDVIAGRYRLEDAVGAGGMGMVWRATDLELRREVALKQASSGNGEETRREARIGAGLHHPNVIVVFDVVVEGDQRWLVMEYLPARSLADICQADGPMAPSLVARVGAQIATALSAMHAKGMVHRDVTPSNILVTDDGVAKLADLGIAAWGQVTLTGTARDAGTPGYVAPEVLDGHGATSASDLYSLGAALSAAVEGHPRLDGRLAGVLSALTDPDPDRRPTAAKAAQLLGRHGAWWHSRPALVATGLGVTVVLVAAFVVILSGSQSTPNNTAGTPDTSARRQVPVPSAAGGARLLYGLGDQINSALASELVRDTPVRMLTTNYHKPTDLSKLAGSRDTMVANAYAQGYALHVIVSDWDVDDPEVPVDTKYGVGCGRPHPLSPDFPRHMRTLARIFAGQADGPPLYVTMFQEVNKFACFDGAYAADPQTTVYYKALKDRYLEVRQIIQDEAPNARVALGWDGYQSNSDHPATSGGRSMFAQFADVLRASDFQSVLVRQPDGNVEQVRRTVRILSEYGPVMMAAYGNKSTPGQVVDQDMRTLLTDQSIAELTGLGMFAWNFNTEPVLLRAGRPTLDFVKDVVRRTGREPR